jgi:multidrug efflux system membrane fusion protein
MMRMTREPTILEPGLLLWAGAILCVGVFAACTKEPVQHVDPVRPVKMLTIGASGEAERREYPGTIEAIQHVDMAFEVPGRVIEFPVEEGQQVAKGEVLARLDPRNYEAKHESAAAIVRKSEADLARSERLTVGATTGGS